MMAIKPERGGTTDAAAETPAPEAQPPSERRAPDKLGAINDAVASAFEGEIREFVRRDVAPRRPRTETDAPAASTEPVADNLNALIRRVSGASTDEIDRVIAELQAVREMLRNEGERVSREIAGYASLNHAAMTAMKVIGESVTQWKNAPGRNDRRP
jgi:hypothetical protein